MNVVAGCAEYQEVLRSIDMLWHSVTFLLIASGILWLEKLITAWRALRKKN